VVIDIGTGDGRSVLARAEDDPCALVIGVDAAAAPMAGASRRADRRGPANALFLAAGVEAVASTLLVGAAHLVTVTFPWGSLLRGVVGLDADALGGIAAALRDGGRLVVFTSILPTDGVDGIGCLDGTRESLIRDAWSGAGIDLVSMRPATAEDVAAARSTWARRLGAERPVWRLEGRRSASIAR
jgi:16S rRNA (adenine(1408)-N(1))-methyltransferase